MQVDHNGHAKSHQYDWCIGRLPDGGSFIFYKRHHLSQVKLNSTARGNKVWSRKEKLYKLETAVGLRDLQFIKFFVVGYYFILHLLLSSVQMKNANHCIFLPTNALPSAALNKGKKDTIK